MGKDNTAANFIFDTAIRDSFILHRDERYIIGYVLLEFWNIVVHNDINNASFTRVDILVKVWFNLDSDVLIISDNFIDAATPCEYVLENIVLKLVDLSIS